MRFSAEPLNVGFSILPGASVIHCVSGIQDNFLRILRGKLNPEIFQMFFENQFELYCDENADSLFVTAKSSFVLDWYRRKFQPLFQEIARELIPAFSGKISISSCEELNGGAVSGSGTVLRKTPPSSADFRTNRERIAHRKQNSREILDGVRRMNIPGVLDLLTAPSAEKILDTEIVRSSRRSFSTGDSSEKVLESAGKTLSVKRHEKSAPQIVSAVRKSSSVPRAEMSMDDFLARMDEMFRQRKISRIFAPKSYADSQTAAVSSGAAPEIRVVEKLTADSEMQTAESREIMREQKRSDHAPSEKISDRERFSGSLKLQKLMASVLKNSADAVSSSSGENVSSQIASSEITQENSLEDQPQRFSNGAVFSTGTFETFVVGYSNRVAYSTAHGIHLNMGLMSPVLFTGGTGVGKTHLLDAIYRNSVKCGFSTVHKTCEEFINDFVASLREQRKKNDFLEMYRECDLLILDNLQFLLGKQGTLAELQNIFNYRIRHGKQIVLASDRPLEKMDELGPELLSKLRGGCVCRLNEPSFDVRLGILAQESKVRKLPLSDEQCQKLANQYVGDVRALIGALNTLEMMTRAQFGIPGRKSFVPSREQTRVVQQLVDDMVNQPGKSVNMDDIKRFVAVQFGIGTVLLSSGQRIRKVSQPRMLAMWLARKFTRKSLAEIGASFGCASHSTVISAQKKVEEWRTHDFKVQTVDSIRSVNELLHQLETQLQRSL